MIVICVILMVILVAENIIFIKMLRQRKELMKQSYRQTEKFRVFFELVAEWFTGEMSGKRISDWISARGYKTVAIYGMGTLGELTYLNLCKNKEICIKYGLDKNTSIKTTGMEIYNLDNCPEQVDLIIVTAVTAYEEIKKEISQKIGFECAIISLLQLVEEMYIG